jgi:outer membrane lipase/esterase
MTSRVAFVLGLGILSTLSANPVLADRATERYTTVTVFGDSLVDAGNIYSATGGTTPNPALGYFQGRFTNGFDYPDLVSLNLFGVPTTPSALGGSNFAYGGARVIDTADGIPDLQAQLGAFQLSGRSIDPNGLYILTFGGNDVFGAQRGAIGSYTDTNTYLQAAAQQYVAGVQALNNLGARNILLTDFPLAGDPFTIAANGYLGAAAASLSLAPDTDFFLYSLSGLNLRVLTNPAAFGLPSERLDTTCIAAGAQAAGCAGIFSFDGTHPTAAIQAAAYRDMNQQFGLTSIQAAVPEPSSWAMMIAGFAISGAALRGKRRREGRNAGAR